MRHSPQAEWKISDDADPKNVKYDDIIWSDLFYDKPSLSVLKSLIDQTITSSDIDYIIKRRQSYPNVEEQLDYIFHNGIDKWKEKIQNIKDNYPKTNDK